MKRFLTLALVLIMMFAVIGCSSSDTDSSSTPQSVTPESTEANDYLSVLMDNNITDYWPVGVPDEIPLCQSVTSGNAYQYEDGTWLLYLLCTNDQVADWERRLGKEGFEGESGAMSNDNYIVEYSSKSDSLAENVIAKGVETMLIITIKNK